MSTTTIKVSKELRDRLRAEADRDGATLAELLESLLELAARARRFEELRDAIAASPGPAASSWAEESEDWGTTDADGLRS